MTLKCQCCGFERDFESPKEAFDIGWDCPPYFTGYVCCDLCPASMLVIPGASHAEAHERWAREGRPASFEETIAKKDLEMPDDEIMATLKKLSPGQVVALKSMLMGRLTKEST